VLPASIEVREIRVQVRQPGYRVESFVAVTTLLDADAYLRDEIAFLYRSRWLAELDIRAIKRRPKEHAYLTKPRDKARARLLKGKPT